MLMRKGILLICSFIIGSFAIAQCDPGFTYSISGGTVTFQADDTAPTTYHHWQFGEGWSFGSGQTTSHTYQSSGQFAVTHSIYDSLNNCSDSLTQMITINLPPTCNANFTLVRDSFQTNIYHVSSTSTATGGTITNYTWHLNDSLISNSHSFSLTLDPGVDTLCLSITTSSGCTSSTCQSITTPASGGCQWQAALNVSNQGPGQYQFHGQPSIQWGTYHWSFGDGSSSTLQNPSHTFSTEGNFLVVLTVTDSIYGCTDSASILLNVTLPPDTNCSAAFDWTASTTNPNHITFTPVGNQSISFVVWMITSATNNYIDSLSDLSPTVVLPDSGTFEVCLYLQTTSGCTAWWCDTVTVAEIDTSSARIGIIPSYPNPASGDNVSLAIQLEQSGGVQMNVFSSTGVIVLSKVFPGMPGRNVFALPVGSLQRGQYFVDIIINGSRKRSTFLKL